MINNKPMKYKRSVENYKDYGFKSINRLVKEPKRRYFNIKELSK